MKHNVIGLIGLIAVILIVVAAYVDHFGVVVDVWSILPVLLPSLLILGVVIWQVVKKN